MASAVYSDRVSVRRAIERVEGGDGRRKGDESVKVARIEFVADWSGESEASMSSRPRKDR